MPSNDRVAGILARFPGPVRLYPSRRKWLLVALGGIAFTAIGIGMVLTGDWTGWFAVGFFGLVAIVAILALLPGSSRLMLDKDGFEATTLYRGARKRWAETSEFGTADISGETFVVFDDLTLTPGALTGFNTSNIGRNSALPDTYGLSAEELANLMSDWRNRARADG